MLRLVSYRSDRTAPAWRAGVASHHALIDLAGYADGTYRSVRSFLAASPDEQEHILAWATRQLETGEQVLSLDQVELGPPVPDPEKIVCLGLNYPEHAAEARLDIPLAEALPTGPPKIPASRVSNEVRLDAFFICWIRFGGIV